jgi:hypothetical protein
MGPIHYFLPSNKKGVPVAWDSFYIIFSSVRQCRMGMCEAIH